MSYEFHCYEGYFRNPTPFYRHDLTPMPGNVVQKEGLMPAGQSSAALSCHQRNRKRKPRTGWEREGGRAEAAGFLKTGLTICMLPAKPTTLVTEDTGNETKRIPKTQCVSGRCSGCKTGHSGRTEANFWHLEVKEHIYFGRLLIMSNHNVCFPRTVCGEAGGRFRLRSSDDQLVFSSVTFPHSTTWRSRGCWYFRDGCRK